MKKLVKLALCLMLAVALGAAPAYSEAADTANANLWMRVYNEGGIYCEAMMVCGDALYLLGDNALYRYLPGDAEPSLFLEGISSAWYIDPMDEEAASLPNANMLFVKDGCLYGFGQTTGQVTRLTDEGGNAVKEPVCKLDMSFNEEGQAYFINVFVMGEAFCLVDTNWEGGFYEARLEDGAKPVKKTVENFISLVPYKDGLMLGAIRPVQDEAGETPTRLVTYDPATDQTTPLYELEAADYSTTVAYDAASGMIYYTSENVVYRLNTPDSAPEVCLYLPEGLDRAGMLPMPGGILALQGYSGIYLRSASQEDASGQLITVMGEYGSGAHVSVLKEHPEIIATPIDMAEDLNALTNAIVTGETKLDVIYTTIQSQPVDKLIQKGYAADLSVYPEIMAVANEMDPRILSLFQKDGGLYAVPVELRGQQLCVNQEVWTETLGLSLDELPATYMELLDFIENFSYDYGEEHGETVTLTDSWDLRAELFGLLLKAELTAQAAEGVSPVKLDTPRFHELLDALDAIDFSDISLAEMVGENPTDDDFDEFYSKQAVFSLYYDLSNTLTNPDSTVVPLVLSLEEGKAPLVAVDMAVMMIAARSACPEVAAAYVASYISHLDPTRDAITLFPNHNEGVPNPNYERNLQDVKDSLAKREKALETAAEENKAQLREDIKWMKEAVTDLEDQQYLVTAETIAEYRETIGAYIYPMLQNPMAMANNDSSLSTLMQQYLSRSIDTNAFVRELDNRLRLMSLENQ